MLIKKSVWLFVVIAFVFAVSSTLSCKKKDEKTSVSTVPSNRCADFLRPTAPGGASELPLLVLRIQFKGDLFDRSYIGDPFAYNHFQSDACVWAKKIFYNATSGQLNHYYKEVSSQQFHLTPAIETQGNNAQSDGVITVTLPGNHPNTRSDPSIVYKLIDALRAADPYIDYSRYDVSGDGVIQRSDLQVLFVVAGYESATGVSLPSIWAHRSCLNNNALQPVLDGVALMGCSGNGYTVIGERHMNSGYDATIGIIAHELGHGIWVLPDLYDIDGDSAGIGNFGLMGSGSWGARGGEHPGQTPVHFSAWSKIKIGWYPGAATGSPGSVSMVATGQSGYNIVKLDISSDSNQYFLLENRGMSGYDSGLYMLEGTTFPGGLAIWHIDDGQSVNSNQSRKWVDLEEANNAELDMGAGHRGKISNLFYMGNNSTFDTNSVPNSRDYSGISTGISVTGIPIWSTSMNVTVQP